MAMRLPSIKKLTEIFGDRAKEARRLLENKIDPEEYSSAAEWVRQCYGRPPWHECVMLALNEVGGFYGVEVVWNDSEVMRPEFEYLNTGEIYATTLIYSNRTSSFRVLDAGTMCEYLERQGVTLL